MCVDHDPVIVVVPFPLHVTPGEGLPDSVHVLPPVTRRGEAENVSVTAVQVSVMPCDVDGGLGNDAVPLALTAKVIVRPETGTVVVPDWEFVHTSVPGATLSVPLPLASTVTVNGCVAVQFEVPLTLPVVQVAVDTPVVVPVYVPANGLPVVAGGELLPPPPPPLPAAAAATPAIATPPMIAAVLSPPTVAVAAVAPAAVPVVAVPDAAVAVDADEVDVVAPAAPPAPAPLDATRPAAAPSRAPDSTMSSVIESLKPAIVRGAFVASVNTLMSPRAASDCHEGVCPDSRAATL